ncbi:hypothetical protein MET9862_05688 [Methylobacterium symbioticum]|uniref:Uncharacterized protein n=1 Tax=Methylobacterium symbioticum TaxID=2584084 RepID=A0A509ELN5_9HYPH|nr:hypothetical protein MET9862_05688 [Methylobacterium symbioticum]
MEVAEDRIVGRGRDADGRRHIGRHRHVGRGRQQVGGDRRRGRGEVHEIGGRLRQEHDRRWGRQGVDRVGEIDHRPLDVDDLVRGRGRQVVDDLGEARRRREGGREAREAAARIEGVRPARVAPQIGPVGVRAVGEPALAPGQRLAPRRQDRPHPRRLRIGRIGSEEVLVALDGVALQAEGEGVPGADLGERARLQGGLWTLQRRCVGRPRQELERRRDARGIPGHQRALGGLHHPQADAIEQLGRGEAAGADHLRQRLDVGAVAAGLVGADRARRGVEGDEAAGFRFHQGEAPGERLALAREGVAPPGIEHEEACLQRQGREALGVVRDAQRRQRHVGGGVDARVHRREIGLALDLEPIARQIDEGDRLGACGLRLLDEVPECLAQPGLVEVARAHHVEAGRLQRLRDEAGIVGGGREGLRGIGRVADDEGEPLLQGLRRARAQQAGERDEKGRDEGAEEGYRAHRRLRPGRPCGTCLAGPDVRPVAVNRG